MRHFLKKFLLLLAAVALAPATMGFSLMGPPLSWMDRTWGYNDTVGDVIGGVRIGPMPLNAFYRWNVPVLTYAFDESFRRYFGTNGMKEVDAAFAVLNNLPPASQINLDDYANNTKMQNLIASQAGLIDLRSYTLGAIFQYMGLAEPEINVWTIRNRAVYTVGNTTYTNYYILQRNFDPYSLLPSSYVNGELYTYRILYYPMPNPFGVAYWDATELPQTFSTVAGWGLGGGEFYNGLTKDDVAGWKYLYGTNTMAVESLIPNVGRAASQFLTTSAGWVGWDGNSAGSNTFTLNSNQLFFVSQGQLVSLTNGALVLANGIRGGVDKITFSNVTWKYYYPITDEAVSWTNVYTDNVIVSNRLFVQKLQRTIAQPDIIFRAADLGFYGDGTLVQSTLGNATFTDNDALNGGTVDGGPGLITGAFPIYITYTTLVPGLYNESPYFLDELWASKPFRWASFDNTPTPPFIYPDGPNRITIDELLNMINSGATNSTL